MSRKSLFISVVGLFLVVFVLGTLIYRNHQATLSGDSASKNKGVFLRQGAPVKGPADARVTIVEFFDPACGTCADFYPFVKSLIERHPGQVRVMLRYAPLHTGSDQVVKMLEAAHLQGRFWPALELLFANQRRWVVNHVSQPMRARGILNGMAMDHDKLDADMNQAMVIDAVQKDIADGQTLKVQATPEFFINGRPLPSFGLKQLSQAVEEAVAEAY